MGVMPSPRRPPTGPLACPASAHTGHTAYALTAASSRSDPPGRLATAIVEAVETVHGTIEGKEGLMAALRKPKGLGQ